MSEAASNASLLGQLASDRHSQQPATVQVLDATYALFRDHTRFWIQRVAVPLIMVIGLFGNLITVIIMTSRRMRSTTNLYLAALAFVDMLYLVLTFLLGLSHYPNMAAKSYALYWHSRPFLMMLTDACSNTSVWLTVTFTIERYIAVRYPMKGKVWCTEARAKKLICCVFVFGLLFASPVPFEWKVIERPAARGQPASVTTTTPASNSSDLSAPALLSSGNELTALAERDDSGGGDDDDDDENDDDGDNGAIIVDQTPRAPTAEPDQLPAVVLALDYSDFGRNETYKTIYYWSTAVIFYFIPLLSLTLFNSFLIKSVHESQRERNKMTNRQSAATRPPEKNHWPYKLSQQSINEFDKKPRAKPKWALDSNGTRGRVNQEEQKLPQAKLKGPLALESPKGSARRGQATLAKQTEPARQLVIIPIDTSGGARNRRRRKRRRFFSLASDAGHEEPARRPDDVCQAERTHAECLAEPTSGTESRPRLKASLSVPENCDKSDQIDLTYRIVAGERRGAERWRTTLTNSSNGGVQNTSNSTTTTTIQQDSLEQRHHLHLPLQRTSTSINQPPVASARRVVNNNNTGRLVNSQSATLLGRNSCVTQQQQQQHHHHQQSGATHSNHSSTQASLTVASAASSSSQERRITIMLISVVILFLVCQIPSAAMLLYTSVHETQPNTNEHALLLAFGNIFNFLMAINAAGNFILYSFLSRKYRRTFVILFCRCFKANTGAARAAGRCATAGAGGGGSGADRARRKGAGGAASNTTELSYCEQQTTQMRPQISYSSMACNSSPYDTCADSNGKSRDSNVVGPTVGRVVSVRFGPSGGGDEDDRQQQQQPIIYEQPTPSEAAGTNGGIPKSCEGELVDYITDKRRTTPL